MLLEKGALFGVERLKNLKMKYEFKLVRARKEGE